LLVVGIIISVLGALAMAAGVAMYFVPRLRR
jgi:flagellar biosynthesis protein FliQ